MSRRFTAGSGVAWTVTRLVDHIARGFRSLSLRWRILLIIAIPVLGISITSAYLDHQTARRALESKIDEQAHTIIGAVRRDVEELAMLGSQNAAIELIEILQSFPSLERVHVYNGQGKNILAYHRADLEYHAPSLIPEPGTRFTEHHMLVAERIGNHLGDVATVYLRVSLAEWAEAKHALLVSTVWNLVGFAALAIILATLLQLFITRPIVTLSGFLRSVSDTSDYTARTALGDRAEIGALGDGIDRLLRHIAEERETILQLNRELRRQIAARSENIEEAVARVAHVRGGLEPGEIFADHYEIAEMLGRGSYGMVYKVHRRSDRRELALKLLHARGKPITIARFAREAKILSQITHPNVVDIRDVGVEAGMLYLVMEYVDGADLREHAHRHGDHRWAIAILAQVARGLEAIHERGIVHRDLKPANIVVVGECEGSPVAKIADFGVAKEIDALPGASVNSDPCLEPTTARIVRGDVRPGNARQGDAPPGVGYTTLSTAVLPHSRARSGFPRLVTDRGNVVGTPRFMAPEMLDEDHRLSSPTDIYSMGIIAYLLLTGRYPHDVPALVQVRRKGTLSPPLSLAEERPEIDRSVATIVDRCLDRNAAARPSASDLAAAFDAALARISSLAS